MTTPHRLWDKGTPVDERIHRFTVGDDPLWDRHLVHWDCLGSAAHALTLARAGLLPPDDRDRLLAALAEIDADDRAGRFTIPPELEDVHTALEAELIRRCGDAGARIHTGRSRNDQVATAVRLVLRHHAMALCDDLAVLLAAALERIDRDGHTPMPGYTHMQPAMPSSVGLWLHALAEGALEQWHAALELLARLDACPLGTGAGYGVPLPLDRAYTAALLGFTRVQRNPIDVQNSRGRLETAFVRVAADTAGLLDRFASDLLLFSTAEFGFFSLAPAHTTGSSIMPQKQNPDVLELTRARAVRLRSRAGELETLRVRLPSGYARDLQLTKEPTIRTALEIHELMAVAAAVIRAFTIHRDRLAAALRPELYATQAALELAQRGVPFREAYRRIAALLASGQFEAEYENALADWRATAGRVPPADLLAARDEIRDLAARTARERSRVTAAEASLLPARDAAAPGAS